MKSLFHAQVEGLPSAFSTLDALFFSEKMQMLIKKSGNRLEVGRIGKERRVVDIPYSYSLFG